MKIDALFNQKLFIPELGLADKKAVIEKMVDKLYENDCITSKEEFLKEVLKREEVAHTAFEGGVATPHAKSSVVKKASVVVAISHDGIDFSDGEEEKSKLFFLIAVPLDNPNLHIDVLAKLAGLIEDEGRDRKSVV